jgi:hypothetical protein|tara:strand:- start:711 stop:815 length:105 start_codon:yes stop_codon:yes gene_type:complete
MMLNKVWSKWNGLNRNIKIAAIVAAIVIVAWIIK